jgi:hypothetical protein
MVARWISVLDTYNYEIEHRRGSFHKNADALSRVPIGHRKYKRTDCPDYVGTVLSISHHGIGSRRLELITNKDSHVLHNLLNSIDWAFTKLLLGFRLN